MLQQPAKGRVPISVVDPTVTPLPKAKTTKIFCLYGVGLAWTGLLASCRPAAEPEPCCPGSRSSLCEGAELCAAARRWASPQSGATTT
jgi:hypothetical protein